MDYGIFDPDGRSAAFPLKGVWIKGDLCGLYGELTVDQLYTNEGEKALEIIYTFPLPDGAVISGFSARVGERMITGEIREKKEAFQVYDQALDKGDSAFLLEQYRPNIFQVSLGQVLPGEEVRVSIVYLETFAYQDGELRITIPTLVAPRYIPGAQIAERKGMGWARPTERVPDADFITPPVDAAAAYRVALELNVQPLMPVEQFSSPSHQLKVKRGENGSTQITLAEGKVPLDRDIVIQGRCREESTATGLNWRDPETGESYCYLSLLPHLDAPLDREPLKYIFLIDASVSMCGDKLEQAKGALQLCLRNMEAGDSFNIVAFGSTCQFFSRSKALPFNQASLDRASHWIDNLDLLGGTDILEPVNFALKNCNKSGTVILLFTDGQVGNEQEIISRVRSKIGGNRLFSFGIDTAVNSHFINKLAEAGNGLPEFIYPGERIEDKVIRQFYRINSPSVSGVAIEWSALPQVECYPQDIPAIFDREPLALVGKYSSAPIGKVSLTGQLKNDRFTAELDLAALVTGHTWGFLKKLWAKMKIDHLEKSLEQISPRRRDRLIEEIVKLSCEYGIASAHTSFVALYERENKATGIPKTVVVPVAPAAKWDMLADHTFTPPLSGTGPAVLFSPRVNLDRGFAPQPMDLHCRSSAFRLTQRKQSRSGALHCRNSAYDPGSSLEDAVRFIALQQLANGSFPAEEGTANAELSRFENTALAAAALLLAGESGLYRRQIEKSVKYLLEAKPQKELKEFHYFTAALAARLYLEKFKIGKRTANQISSKAEVLQGHAGSLAAALHKPDKTGKEMIANLLGFTGDSKSSLENVGPGSSIKTLAAAIFRELLR